MINEKERIYFRVVKWDGTKGVIVDRQKFQYDINRNNLAPECEGTVIEGDLVSGTVKDFETIGDILIEQGSNPISERKGFDSVGLYSEAKGAWEPRGTPHDALNGGKPDSGDARTRTSGK
jgi:hypothetical protein